MTSSRKSRVPCTNTIASFPGSMFGGRNRRVECGGESGVESGGEWSVASREKVESGGESGVG